MPQYQGVWTLPVAARLQSTQQWATDPLYRNTTLLLQADNAPNGAQNNTFIDSSSNNFTITRNGNTTQGTFTPFSATGWGNYFNGGSDDLSLPTNAALAPQTSDFCFECWIYRTEAFTTSYSTIYAGDASNGIFIGQLATGLFGVRERTNVDILSRTSPSTNKWVHIAVTRSGSSLRMFYDGVQQGATVTDSTNFTSGTNTIGLASGTFPFYGYISNLRFVKGSAVYTSNFTPSQIPLTAITNTSLLTCQNNRFVDNSTNNFTLTANGNVSVQAFSPFAPQYQWTAPVIGGSGYFDGTGDYLSATGSSATQMGTGAFTWECWCYITTTASYQCLIDTRASPSSGSSTGMALLLDTGTFTPIAATTGTILTSSINVQRNAWNHVALTRSSGGTLTIWVNGASGGTVSNSTNLTDTALWVGGNNTSPFPAPVNGYLSNTRITKGADLYTATFTPPTAPLTTTVSSGTVGFLLNYTNAGIVDGTMKNNLETVGNAQVNTSIVKYGTGSMAFDGSGDYLTGPTNSPSFQFGTGDFTVEMWVNTANLAAYQTLLDVRSADTQSAWCLFLDNTGKPYWYDASGVQLSSTAVAANTWTHLAVSRLGSTLRMFLSGVQVFSGTNSNAQNPTGTFYVGRNAVNAFLYTGYIDDLRITKGIARYTANFTPPTVALPRQ